MKRASSGLLPTAKKQCIRNPQKEFEELVRKGELKEVLLQIAKLQEAKPKWFNPDFLGIRIRSVVFLHDRRPKYWMPLVTALKDAGGNVNYSHRGHSALSYLCGRGDLPGIKFLIKLGVDLDMPMKRGNGALESLVVSGRRACLKWLIQQGHKTKYYPLHMCAKVDFDPNDIMDILFEGKFDVEQLNDNKETPLQVAFKHENYAAAEYLLDIGGASLEGTLHGKPLRSSLEYSIFLEEYPDYAEDLDNA